MCLYVFVVCLYVGVFVCVFYAFCVFVDVGLFVTEFYFSIMFCLYFLL